MFGKGCESNLYNQTASDNILKCNFDKRNMYVTMGL